MQVQDGSKIRSEMPHANARTQIEREQRSGSGGRLHARGGLQQRNRLCGRLGRYRLRGRLGGSDELHRRLASSAHGAGSSDRLGSGLGSGLGACRGEVGRGRGGGKVSRHSTLPKLKRLPNPHAASPTLATTGASTPNLSCLHPAGPAHRA